VNPSALVDRAAPLFPERRPRHRVFGGLTERQEHIFTWIAVAVVLLFVTAWVGAVVEMRSEIEELPSPEPRPGIMGPPAPLAPATNAVTNAITDARGPIAPRVNEALNDFLEPLRGESGKLRFHTTLPGEDPPGVPSSVRIPDEPGLYRIASAIDQVNRATTDAFSIFTLVPRSEKRGGRIGPYFVGNWPFEKGGRPRTPAYAPPSGFIEVTPENQDTYVSEHFRLRDFLTKDQRNVWPKYLLLNPKMIDKLELVIQDLEARGIEVEIMTVMSGFRTPQYNHSGGNTAGRANLSRHMYGDAADVYVDNDRNGNMDDINGDGRVTTADADVIAQAAERVERRFPSLVGGIGVYKACCGHGPFTHVDVRGFRARWRE
jgi:hypothetical protein